MAGSSHFASKRNMGYSTNNMADFSCRRLGVLGGMSWMSTGEYYEILNREVLRLTGSSRAAELVLWSFDTTKIEAKIATSQWASIGEDLTEAAQKLVQCGAEGLIIASNTIHKVVDKGFFLSPLPLIHIRDSLLRELELQSIKRIGLIATSSTMGNGIYSDIFSGTSRIDVVVPPRASWDHIDDVIFNHLCRGSVRENDRRFVSELIENFCNQGIHAVVFGCTELGLLDIHYPGVVIFDTTEIHAKDAARWSLGLEPEAQAIFDLATTS